MAGGVLEELQARGLAGGALPSGVRVIHVDDLKTLLREAAQEGVRGFLEEIGVKRDDVHLLRQSVEFQKALDRTKGEVGREIAKTVAKALIWIFALGIVAAIAKGLGLSTALGYIAHRD